MVCSAAVTRPCICCRKVLRLPETSIRHCEWASIHRWGHLELGDLTGWDYPLCPLLRYLHSALGEKFARAHDFIKMVCSRPARAENRHGVYRYEDGKAVPGSRRSQRQLPMNDIVIVDAVTPLPVGSLFAAVLAGVRADHMGRFDN